MTNPDFSSPFSSTPRKLYFLLRLYPFFLIIGNSGSNTREYWLSYWEAGKNSQLRNMVLEKQNKTRAKIVDFFVFYRKHGSFIQEFDELDDEELEHELVGAFLGSIFASVTRQTIGIVKARFNIDRHVRCFLKGYGPLGK